jgi:hypothetical protein
MYKIWMLFNIITGDLYSLRPLSQLVHGTFILVEQRREQLPISTMSIKVMNIKRKYPFVEMYTV